MLFTVFIKEDIVQKLDCRFEDLLSLLWICRALDLRYPLGKEFSNVL